MTTGGWERFSKEFRKDQAADMSGAPMDTEGEGDGGKTKTIESATKAPDVAPTVDDAVTVLGAPLDPPPAHSPDESILSKGSVSGFSLPTWVLTGVRKKRPSPEEPPSPPPQKDQAQKNAQLSTVPQKRHHASEDHKEQEPHQKQTKKSTNCAERRNQGALNTSLTPNPDKKRFHEQEDHREQESQEQRTHKSRTFVEKLSQEAPNASAKKEAGARIFSGSEQPFSLAQSSPLLGAKFSIDHRVDEERTRDNLKPSAEVSNHREGEDREARSSKTDHEKDTETATPNKKKETKPPDVIDLTNTFSEDETDPPPRNIDPMTVLSGMTDSYNSDGSGQGSCGVNAARSPAIGLPKDDRKSCDDAIADKPHQQVRREDQEVWRASNEAERQRAPLGDSMNRGPLEYHNPADSTEGDLVEDARNATPSMERESETRMKKLDEEALQKFVRIDLKKLSSKMLREVFKGCYETEEELDTRLRHKAMIATYLCNKTKQSGVEDPQLPYRHQDMPKGVIHYMCSCGHAAAVTDTRVFMFIKYKETADGHLVVRQDEDQNHIRCLRSSREFQVMNRHFRTKKRCAKNRPSMFKLERRLDSKGGTSYEKDGELREKLHRWAHFELNFFQNSSRFFE